MTQLRISLRTQKPPLVSIAVLNSTAKSNLGKGGLFHPTTLSHNHLGKSGTQSRNREAEPETEVMETGSTGLLPHGMLNLLCYTTQGHVSKGGIIPTKLDLPT